MRQGHVLKYALIAGFVVVVVVVVDDEVEVITWPFCRAKYGRIALTFLL